MVRFASALIGALAVSSAFAAEDNLVRIKMNKIDDEDFTGSFMARYAFLQIAEASKETRNLRGKEESEVVKDYQNAQYYAEVEIGT